ISEILPERLVSSRSKKVWRFSQNSAFVLKYRARRSAVSAVIRRRSCTISPMRVAGTCSSSASLFTVKPNGFMKSSRRTSPGCTGGIHCSDLPIFFPLSGFQGLYLQTLSHECPQVLILNPLTQTVRPVDATLTKKHGGGGA